MKKSIKILALLLVLIMMVGCFAGCAKDPVDTTPKDTTPKDTTPKDTTPKDTTPATTAPKDYKDVDFKVWWWGGEPRNTNTALAIDEFEKSYTNLDVSVSFAGFGDHFTAIDMAIAGNAMPDVIQNDYQKVYLYASAGKLLKLDEYIESGRLDMSGATEGDIDMGRFYDGGVYAISTGSNAWTWAYRMDLVEEAGVTIPEGKLFSMDDFIEICKKIYDETGAQTYMNHQEYFWGAGMDLHSEDGTEVGFTAEALADWLKVQADGVDYGWLYNSMTATEGVDQSFYTGKVWARPAYNNAIPNYPENAACEIGWFCNPYVGDSLEEVGFTAPVKPAMYWSIAADCKNVDLAIDFLNFMLKSEKYYEICGLDRGLPIFSDVLEKLEPTMDDKQKFMQEMMLEQKEIGNLGHPPYNAQYASLAAGVIWDLLDMNLLGGEYRPEGAAERLAAAKQVVDTSNYVLQGGEI